MNSSSGTMARSSAEEKSSWWISFCSHSVMKAGVVRPSNNRASQLEDIGLTCMSDAGGGTGGNTAGNGVDSVLAGGTATAGATAGAAAGAAAGAGADGAGGTCGSGASTASDGGTSTGSVKLHTTPKDTVKYFLEADNDASSHGGCLNHCATSSGVGGTEAA